MLMQSLWRKFSTRSVSELRERIKLHEGKRNKPYLDSEGILTVGYGRNLRDISFTDHEINIMFETDYQRALIAAQIFDQYWKLNKERKGVILELCFWLGPASLKKFVKFWAAVRLKDWTLAKGELIDSKMHTQAPKRTETLAEIFLHG